MPRSAIAMAEFDGEYVFDINQYLIGAYPSMNLPARRGVCEWVRAQLDEDEITDQIDAIVREYALNEQGWKPEEDDDDEE